MHLISFPRSSASYFIVLIGSIADISPRPPVIAGEVLFADVSLLPNGMSKVGTTVKDTGCFFWFISFVGFLWDVVIDGDGHGRPRVTCRDAGT